MNAKIFIFSLMLLKVYWRKSRYKRRAKGRISFINRLEQRVSQELITMQRTVVRKRKHHAKRYKKHITSVITKSVIITIIPKL